MPRNLLLLILLCTGSILHAAALTWEATSITMPAEATSTEIPFVYTFQVTGDKPVTLTSMINRCGCATITSAQKTYQPGERGTVTAMFQVGDREGPQKRTIEIVTDEPETPTYELQMVTDIPPIFRLRRRVMVWNEDYGTGPQSSRLTVLPPYKVTSVVLESADPKLVTGTVTTVTPGEVYDLTLALAPGAHQQRRSIRVWVKTDHPIAGRARIGLWAAVELAPRKQP